MRLVCAFLLCWILFLGSYNIVMADSSAIAGTDSGTVIPLTNKEIKLVSEKISIEILEQEEAKVSIDYIFKNTSNKDIRVWVGFPELAEYRSDENRIKHFKAYINNQSIKKVSSFEGDDNWRKDIDSNFNNREDDHLNSLVWHTYHLNFDAGQETHVKNTYTQSLPGGSGGKGTNTVFQYILATGALWKDKINKVDIEIFLRDSSLYKVLFISPIGEDKKWKISPDLKHLYLTLYNIEPTKNDNIIVYFSDKVLSSRFYDWKLVEISVKNQDEMATATSFLEKKGYPDCFQGFPCFAVDGKDFSSWISNKIGDKNTSHETLILHRDAIPDERPFNSISLRGGGQSPNDSEKEQLTLYQLYARPKKIKVSLFKLFKNGYVKKESFANFGGKQETIWNALIKEGYINRNGLILTKFYDIQKFHDFYLPGLDNYYTERYFLDAKIFNIIDDAQSKSQESFIFNLPDNIEEATLQLGKWITYDTNKIEIEVLDIYPGKKYNQVAIAEVSINGISKDLLKNIIKPSKFSKKLVKRLTLSGWILLISSWGIIIGLTLFCFYRVFTEPEKDL